MLIITSRYAFLIVMAMAMAITVIKAKRDVQVV
jgi:hypothetical protein